MFAPKWARGPHNLARFPSWDPCITPGYWAWYLNVLPTSGSLFRSLFYAFMPREGMYTCVFCPPPPLSEENPVMLHFFAYAEIIFAHILVFPACAIEMQHINENSPTISGFGARLVPFYVSPVLLMVFVLFCKFSFSIFYFVMSSDLYVLE